jgi:hypothetical protein
VEIAGNPGLFGCLKDVGGSFNMKAVKSDVVFKVWRE